MLLYLLFMYIYDWSPRAQVGRSVVATTASATTMECNKQHPRKSVPQNNTHKTRRKSFGIRIFSYIGYHFPYNSLTFSALPLQ